METTEINSTAVPHFQRQCSCEWRKHNDERIHSIKKEPTPSKWTNVTRDFSKACSRRSFSRPRNQAMKKKKNRRRWLEKSGCRGKKSHLFHRRLCCCNDVAPRVSTGDQQCGVRDGGAWKEQGRRFSATELSSRALWASVAQLTSTDPLFVKQAGLLLLHRIMKRAPR